MINVLVEGKKLDLYPINISFKRTNNAFSYGKLELSRTLNFKIPKTPLNLNVLGASSIYTYGVEERRYLDAQMQGSGFVENGLLYINEVDNDYHCVFLFGDLFILKNVADVKKIASVLEPYDAILSVPQQGKNANADNIAMYDFVKYQNNTFETSGSYYRYLMPSISVRGLFKCANEIFGEVFDLSVINDYRIIQQNVNDAKRKDVILAKSSVNQFAPNQNLKLLLNTTSNYECIFSSTGQRGQYIRLNTKQYYAFSEVELTFPEEFPSNLFCVGDRSDYGTDGFVNINVQFYGDYSFDTSVRAVSSLDEEGLRATTGEPLAGRTITIPAYTIFSFYDINSFHNTTNRAGESDNLNHYRGFFNGDASPFDFEFPEVKISVGAWEGNRAVCTTLVDSVPGISFIELLSAIAVIENKYITYDAELHKITIKSLDPINFVSIKNPISYSLERTSITSSRNNYIREEPNGGVASPSDVNYGINNETLSEEDTIFEVPFSLGNNINGNIYIDDIKIGINDVGLSTYALQTDVPLLALSGLGNYLRYSPLSIDNILSNMYVQSTRINLTCEMSMFEYINVKETDFIVYKNQKWAWISSTWQKNKAKFVLQKI